METFKPGETVFFDVEVQVLVGNEDVSSLFLSIESIAKKGKQNILSEPVTLAYNSSRNRFEGDFTLSQDIEKGVYTAIVKVTGTKTAYDEVQFEVA